MQDNSGKLLNIKAAAKMLCVAPATLYMWASAGRIPHVRLGNRCIRFQVAQLIDFIRNNSVFEKEATPKAPMRQQNRKGKRQAHKNCNNKYLDDLLIQAKKDILDIQ